MKTIIVSTDFSPVADNALNYAVAMAQQTGATLTLFNAYQIPISVTETPIILVSVDELRDAAQQQLDDLKQSVEKANGDKLKVYAELAMGNAEDELEELCQKTKPFAVIAGTTGASAVERRLFGSTTLKIIRRLTCPVIAVPADAKYENAIKKIGMACDFSKVVESTPFTAIKHFVKQFNASFHVLNIDHEGKYFTPEKPHESLLFHNEMAELNPEYHFLENADIEKGISDFAETNNLDMVLTIPKKHNLLESLFRKSATKVLVFHSHIPVVTIHE